MTAQSDRLLAEKVSLAADAVQGVLDAFGMEPAQDCQVLAETLLFILLADHYPTEREQVIDDFASLVKTMLFETTGRIDAAASIVKRERRREGNVTELQPGMLP